MKLKKTALWLFLSFAVWLPAVLAGQAPAKEIIRAVDSVGITVADMERSVKFYSKALSFEKVSDAKAAGSDYERLLGISGLRMRVVRMRLRDEFIELTEYLTPKGRPIPADSRSNDHWFQHIAIVVSDMDRAYQRLRNYKVEHVSTAPQRIPDWNEAAAGIRAFYFKDPDGHTLEIIYYPPGKGNPRWQNTAGKLFLGIDHTAIAVSNTDKSLGFYRDLLAMKLGGGSLNYGIEQEQLSGVAGARVRINMLRANSGPGIELLDYLNPRDGRPIPSDTRANDLMHWQTRLVTRKAEAAAQSLLAGKSVPAPPGVVALPKATLGFRKAFLVRDPDGHAMQLTEK